MYIYVHTDIQPIHLGDARQASPSQDTPSWEWRQLGSLWTIRSARANNLLPQRSWRQFERHISDKRPRSSGSERTRGNCFKWRIDHVFGVIWAVCGVESISGTNNSFLTENTESHLDPAGLYNPTRSLVQDKCWVNVQAKRKKKGGEG